MLGRQARADAAEDAVAGPRCFKCGKRRRVDRRNPNKRWLCASCDRKRILSEPAASALIGE